MNYYNFHIGDYRRDTVHLSRLEHSIYRDLIDLYYLDEAPIPVETQWVSRRLRLGSDEEANALKNILSDFFCLQDDGYHHPRIDAEIADYHRNAAKNRANGKKGGRPKALREKEENPLGFQSVASGNPVESQTKGNQEPITNNHISNTDVLDKAQKPAPRFNPVSRLIDLGVSKQVAEDWVTLRKQKRAATTETAIVGVMREAGKAGVSLQDAIAQCCARGWQGFKADWLNESMQDRGGSTYRSASDKRAATIAFLTGQPSPSAPRELPFIDGEARHVG